MASATLMPLTELEGILTIIDNIIISFIKKKKKSSSHVWVHLKK